MCQRDPVQCIIPPYITERLQRSDNAEVRARADANLVASATMRAARARQNLEHISRELLAPPPTKARKQRLLYDARRRDQLPGTLVRSEGQPEVADPAV